MKDFEPYRILWSTASDWLRSYDSWMNDPIISVNAEDIEKNVTEMYVDFLSVIIFHRISRSLRYKNMHKSIKTFTENEGNVKRYFLSQFNQIFSAKFIRFAQLFDSDIKDIRGSFSFVLSITLYSENCPSLEKKNPLQIKFVLFSLLSCMII